MFICFPDVSIFNQPGAGQGHTKKASNLLRTLLMIYIAGWLYYSLQGCWPLIWAFSTELYAESDRSGCKVLSTAGPVTRPVASVVSVTPGCASRGRHCNPLLRAPVVAPLITGVAATAATGVCWLLSQALPLHPRDRPPHQAGR